MHLIAFFCRNKLQTNFFYRLTINRYNYLYYAVSILMKQNTQETFTSPTIDQMNVFKQIAIRTQINVEGEHVML